MTFLTEVNFPFLGTAKHRSNWSPLHEISQHFKSASGVFVHPSDVWLVNFKQWEQTGEEQQGGETCSSLYAIYKG
ncbi:unnamed protein product [Lactuca virosa]|uniref:Uncharacterized protein n=1 Tax=Lactuca virosa TaxID=75947 RepID=A0AAU9N9T8_9ASTR|nr:unnamed protein product [Lactuca virosa]